MRLCLVTILLSCAILNAGYSSAAFIRRDGSNPSLPSDPNTTKYCTFWADLDTAQSCASLLSDNGITLAEFRRWNPSIKENCAGLTVGHSYCVEAFFEPTATTTMPSTPVTPTPTKSPNGIQTPSPTQPQIVDNCDSFYLVQSGDTCDYIAGMAGITSSQVGEWNPSVGSTCNSLKVNAYACISVIGHSPTPTSPGNGVQTPQPIQSGMIGNCGKFHLVQKDQACGDILKIYSISLAQFSTWNPAVQSDCRGLWYDTYACVGVIRSSTTLIPTTQTPVTTTRTVDNGISTPTPTQPNMVSNCDKFYLTQKDDTCDLIASKSGITSSQFTAWNPSVGNDCRDLQAGVYVCISILGHEPTPVNPGNGVSTPTPTQQGMTKNCRTFHFVKKDENCESISTLYKITVAQFTSWNPAARSDCSGLWSDTYACVALL